MLRTKLQDDLTQALKDREADKLSILRFVMAKIKNQEIEKKAELSDEETMVILKKVDRELHESLDAAKKGSREDLVAENTKQIKLLAPYIPAQMSDVDLEVAIKKLIEENKDVAAKNPKAIIGICMGRLRSQADPTRIMSTLRALVPDV